MNSRPCSTPFTLSTLLALTLAIGCGETQPASEKSSKPAPGAANRAPDAAGNPLAKAAEVDVIKLVPDEALGVVVLTRLIDADAKVAMVSKKLQIPLPGLLTLAKTLLGAQAGLNDEGSAAIVALPPPEGEESSMPAAVLLLPVSDYPKFIAQFRPAEEGSGISKVHIGDEVFLVGQKGSHAALIQATEGMRKILDGVIARREGVPASVALYKDWIAAHDISGVLTTGGVKVSMAAVRGGLAKAKQGLPADQPELKFAGQALEMYDKLFEAIENDVTQSALGLVIEPTGTVRLASRTRFTGSGTLGKNAAALKPPATRLAGLPAGPFIMAGEGAFGLSGGGAMTDLSIQMMKAMSANSPNAKMTDADWEQAAEQFRKSMEGVHSMSMVMGVPGEGKSMYENLFTIIKADSAQQYVDDYVKMMTKMSELFKGLNNPFFGQYAAKMTQVDGIAAAEVEMDFSQLVEAMNAGDVQRMPKMFELMFGPGGKLRGWLALADETTVVMAWVNPAHLNKAIAVAKTPATGLAADAGVQATAALFPKGSQWTMFLSPAGMMDFTNRMIKAAAPQAAMNIPNFPTTPPLGLGARLDTDGFTAELVLPAATLEGIGNYIGQVQKAMMERGGAPPPAKPQVN